MPFLSDPELDAALDALHERVRRALTGAVDAVVNNDLSRAKDVRTDHRLLERSLRDLEHLALVRMVDADAPDAAALTRYLQVGVQLAQIGDLARAMAILPTSSRATIELDSSSVVHAVTRRLEQRLAGVVAAFIARDVEAARALEDADPTVAVLLNRLHELGLKRAPTPPATAKCASHLRLIDSLITSVAGLTRSAGAPMGF